MKKLLTKLTLTLLLATLLINCSAEKNLKKVAEVSTTVASNITLLTATSGGNVIDDGGANVTERGIVWNTAAAPTTSLTTKTIDGTGVGSFSSAIANLSPSTNYFVRAYATNSEGIAYGNEITFTTGSIVLPTLSTNVVSGITNNSATLGGTISSDGGATINARGVCWSTNTNPTIALSTKTTDGTGIGVFTSTISGFTANTTYYVRAYATNSAGTSYGTEISFTTLTTLTITIGNQTWSATNLNVATYSDGTVIPQVTDPTAWNNLTTGAWCYYNNNPANGGLYGKLYNWYAVAGIWNEVSKTDLSQRKKLAPMMYHIPSDSEWTILTTYLGGKSVAGGKAKETGIAHWRSPNQDATNTSDFTGLPGGFCSGTFNNVGANGIWWSFSDYSLTSSLSRVLTYDLGSFDSLGSKKSNGYSVRCIRD